MTLGGARDTIQRRGALLCFLSLFGGIQKLRIPTLNLSMEFLPNSFNLTLNMSPHYTLNNLCSEDCTFQQQAYFWAVIGAKILMDDTVLSIV